MTVAAHVFREYDIRGIVGKDLSSELAHGVGRAYGSALREALLEEEELPRTPVVVVGADNRPSSFQLREALVGGLSDAGVDSIVLGTVPTPVAYWAEKELGADGAIQITGSHNPPEWNGIKMTMLGRPFYGNAITALRERILADDVQSGTGSRHDIDVLDRYVEDLAGRFEITRPVRMVVDCGNGTGSVVAVRLLESVGISVTPLFCESDGTFPNHHPDPSVDENLAELIRVVRESNAEVGVAFDGDADRIGVVDEEGSVLRGDILLLLFGLDLLSRRGPGQLLIHDVKCSQLVSELFEQSGGRTLMWKTGHSLIKEKMLETGAPLGGELSGHICFADEFIGSDDALYAACRLARMLAESDVPLSRMTEDFPAYVSTPEIRIAVTEESKTEIVEQAAEHFGALHDVIDVDGVRVLFPGGWALLRASNTQPVLVVRIEAEDQHTLSGISDEVMEWLGGQGIHA